MSTCAHPHPHPHTHTPIHRKLQASTFCPECPPQSWLSLSAAWRCPSHSAPGTSNLSRLNHSFSLSPFFLSPVSTPHHTTVLVTTPQGPGSLASQAPHSAGSSLDPASQSCCGDWARACLVRLPAHTPLPKPASAPHLPRNSWHSMSTSTVPKPLDTEGYSLL